MYDVKEENVWDWHQKVNILKRKTAFLFDNLYNSDWWTDIKEKNYANSKSFTY